MSMTARRICLAAKCLPYCPSAAIGDPAPAAGAVMGHLPLKAFFGAGSGLARASASIAKRSSRRANSSGIDMHQPDPSSGPGVRPLRPSKEAAKANRQRHREPPLS